MPHLPFRRQEDPRQVRGTLLATLTGHTDQAAAVAWSRDGRLLASGGWDKTMRIWDPARLQAVATVEAEPEAGLVVAVAWSRDGRLVAFAGENLHLWNAPLGEHLPPLIRELPPEVEVIGVDSVAWSPDSRMLASGYDDGTITLWDTSYSTQLATIQAHPKYHKVSGLAWSPDGRLLASAGGNDKAIRLWEGRTGQAVAVFSTSPYLAQSVAWSPDGRLLATGGASEPQIWDAFTGKQLSYKWKGHTEIIWEAAWSPDGRLLATASQDQTVGLWDVSKGQHLATLTGHTNGVLAVAWSPDGRLLASASQDQTVRLWSVE